MTRNPWRFRVPLHKENAEGALNVPVKVREARPHQLTLPARCNCSGNDCLCALLDRAVLLASELCRQGGTGAQPCDY
jgi:hypothetical protein